ncbi:hypothetical protein [Mycolicibacterium sp. NCC-Tsukiji]|uniref:hypothetical protein n=1 Tax=Mycolicibacterium sp. NCC-Tsukiji TaxID=2185272 RepID=UPI000EBF7EB3|nr:hypothetical protein [Mycolicibacterium sp. NCC-Tsukiji]GCB00351.1 hypothetical protein NCCNTM_39850 [Mycolicibacterium sp. NCC-Tsukiji]
MTQPPQSGPWGAHPPQQPGNWQGYPGGPHGPGPQGQWNPQQQWPNPAPAPQKKGPLKWVLGAIALIAVIAVTAVVAVSCAGGNGSNNGGGGNTPSSGSKSDIASANDTGPVSVITEDPSCAPWGPINDTLANSLKNGWDQRDPSIPASAWTPEMQALYQSASTAFRNAADQTVSLIKVTKHRVMRELYQQYVAYIHAFVENISSYSAIDNQLVTVGSTLGSVLNGICQAITFGSAATRAPLVPPASSPKHVASSENADKPTKFMGTSDSDCPEWQSAADGLTSDPAFLQWVKHDPSLPASSWPPQYLTDNDAVKPVFNRSIEAYEKLSANSSNPVIADFGTLAAQYGHAFIQGMPTYTQPDIYLYTVFLRAPGAIAAACRSVGAS